MYKYLRHLFKFFFFKNYISTLNLTTCMDLFAICLSYKGYRLLKTLPQSVKHTREHEWRYTTTYIQIYRTKYMTYCTLIAGQTVFVLSIGGCNSSHKYIYVVTQNSLRLWIIFCCSILNTIQLAEGSCSYFNVLQWRWRPISGKKIINYVSERLSTIFLGLTTPTTTRLSVRLHNPQIQKKKEAKRAKMCSQNTVEFLSYATLPSLFLSLEADCKDLKNWSVFKKEVQRRHNVYVGSIHNNKGHYWWNLRSNLFPRCVAV